MTTRPTRRAVLALAGSVAAYLLGGQRVARGDDAGVDRLLARIASARAPVRNTLQGPFTQTRAIGLLATDDAIARHAGRSSGPTGYALASSRRPTTSPFWVGPEGLAYRSAVSEGRLSAGAARVADALQDLHALLGGDLTRLKARWLLGVLRDDASGAEIEATARNPPPEGTRGMRLALGPDLVRPARAVLVEGARDRTQIEFGELTINAPVDERSMRPPA